MKRLNRVLMLMLTLSVSVISKAGTVEVNWIEPDKFADADAPFASIQDTREDTFYALEKHLSRLGKALPEGYTLTLDVQDLDLAGEAIQQDIRVVRDGFPPRIEFSYELVDQDGKVLSKGQENIRDLVFLTNRPARYRNEIYAYEKQLLDRWFKKAFTDYSTNSK